MIVQTKGAGLLSLNPGSIELTETHVIVRRKGSRTEFRARYDQVTGVHLDPDCSNGQILTVNEPLKKHTDNFQSGSPSMFWFKRRQMPELENLRDEIERRINSSKKTGSNFIEELEKLGALRSQGLLSEQEFDAAKAKLLR